MQLQCWAERAVALVEQVRTDGLAGRHGALLRSATKHASVSQPCAVNVVQLNLPLSANLHFARFRLQAC